VNREDLYDKRPLDYCIEIRLWHSQRIINSNERPHAWIVDLKDTGVNRFAVCGIRLQNVADGVLLSPWNLPRFERQRNKCGRFTI
jgi:hypothetical protein